jgi:hypothetical protein
LTLLLQRRYAFFPRCLPFLLNKSLAEQVTCSAKAAAEQNSAPAAGEFPWHFACTNICSHDTRFDQHARTAGKKL